MSVHFSSKTDNWETPQDLFDKLNEKYHFNLDPCATKENAKCKRYFTKEEDGLKQSWKGRAVFMNPPYGKEIGKWVQKANYSATEDGTFVVALLPARTDTKWFHDYCKDREIEFIKGRLKFGGHKNPAPFPSMIVLFWNDVEKWT